MNKKSLVILLVLVLAVSGLFAKDSGFKIGGQVGWGFNIERLKFESDAVAKAKNNGLACNLLGEYAFNENWGIVANVGMMFAGKTTQTFKSDTIDKKESDDRGGLYVGCVLDLKYTYVINEKSSCASLIGLDFSSGHFTKNSNSSSSTSGSGAYYSDNDFYTISFGVNLGVEYSYKITDRIAFVGGASGSWYFVNSSKYLKGSSIISSAEKEKSYYTFFFHPYVGALYAF